MKEEITTILSTDYPFLEDVQHLFRLKRTNTRSKEVSDGLVREKMTITMEKEYIPFGYARMYQKKEVLCKLSSIACKVLVYMGYTLHFDSQKIKMNATLVGMERRAFSKAVKELETARILRKEKREHYWVNVTIIIVGTMPALPHTYDILNKDAPDAKPMN